MSLRTKACKHRVVMSFSHTRIFDRYVIRRGSKSKHHKNTCSKEIGLHLQILTTTLHSTVNTIGRTCVYIQSINQQHALPITKAKSRKVRFSINFLQTVHFRITNVTRVLSCKSNRGRSRRTWKTEPNNTHAPQTPRT
jgi:hypothetical protein